MPEDGERVRAWMNPRIPGATSDSGPRKARTGGRNWRRGCRWD